jgi:hypothetical protein
VDAALAELQAALVAAADTHGGQIKQLLFAFHSTIGTAAAMDGCPCDGCTDASIMRSIRMMLAGQIETLH